MRDGAGATVQHRRRGLLVPLMAAILLSTAGCSSSVPPPPRSSGCAPRTLTVSEVSTRPGDRIELAAAPAGCAVRFTQGGRLTVTMRPEGGARGPAIVLAHPRAATSGAFAVAVRVPSSTPVGDWIVRVERGLATTQCVDTGTASCAAPEAYLRVVDAAVDYSRGAPHRAAQQVAAQVADRLRGDPGFLAVAVRPAGVQVAVAHPFRDRADRIIEAAQVAALGGLQHLRGAPADGRVPVTRFNGLFNASDLLRLEAKVMQDRARLARLGLVLRSVRRDAMNAAVVLELDHYSDRRARLLAARYGTGVRIVVPPGG